MNITTLNHESLIKEKQHSAKLSRSVSYNNFTIKHFHEEYDPNGIHRISVEQNDLYVEILPSQGMAIRKIVFGGKSILWDPPIDILPDPATLDRAAPLLIDGQLTTGYCMVTTLASGIMMFGLSNWGMPYTDEITGKFYPLHGEVSNIPVHDVNVSYSTSDLSLVGEIVVRSCEGKEGQIWYERGEELFSIIKRVIIQQDRPRLLLIDTILNVSKRELKPSWGYTIKLKPDDGASYLVPSKMIENRFGEAVDVDHELWRPAEKQSTREERGYIHKGLKATHGILDGEEGIETIFRYKNGRAILLTLPVTPYFLSWFSAGGKGSTAIMEPGNGSFGTESIFKKNWDGAGPEFGSDALDHDGNVDTEVVIKTLKPGEMCKIAMSIEMLDNKRAQKIEDEILKYNKNMKISVN